MIPSRSILFLLLGITVIGLIPMNPASAQNQDEALKLYYSANALYNRKLYTLAAEEYESFIRQHPRHDKGPNARLGLALCYYALEDRDKAEPLLSRLVNEDSLENQQEIHNLWGQCLLSADRLEEAERAFAWSVAHGRDDEQRAHARVGQIEAQYRQSLWKKVVGSCDQFLRRHSSSPQIQRVTFQGGVARYELGKFEEAGKLLQSIINPDEDTPFMQHIYFLLAECHREQGRKPEAIAHYHIAATRLSGAFTAEALFRMGFIHFHEHEYSKASRHFMELIENHGASASVSDAVLLLGRCHLESKSFSKAEQIFDSFPAKTLSLLKLTKSSIV